MDEVSESRRQVAYIVSEELIKVSSLLPSNRGRSKLVHQLVVACGLLRSRKNASGAIPVRPTVANREDLATFHDGDYLDYVLDPAPRRQPGGQAKEFGIEDAFISTYP